MQLRIAHSPARAAVRRPVGVLRFISVVLGTWLCVVPALALGASPTQDFTGRWRSSFGLVELVQQKARVNGTYSCCDGVIDGQVNAAGRLEFRWQDPTYGRGWGWFELEDQGQALRGAWGHDGAEQPAGDWNAARVRESGFGGEPSFWRVEGEEPPAGRISGAADLYLNGDRLEGKMVVLYVTDFQGEPRRIEVTNLLKGRKREDLWHIQWKNDATGSSGGMKLAEQSGRLSGIWWQHRGRDYGELTLTPTAQAGRAADPEALADRKARSEARIAGDTHLAEAIAYSGESRWDEAAAAFQEALALFEQARDTEKIAETLIGLARVQQAVGELDEAKDSLCRLVDLGAEVSAASRTLAEAGLAMLWVELIPAPSLAQQPLDLCRREAAADRSRAAQSAETGGPLPTMTPSRPRSQATARAEAVGMLFDGRPEDAVKHLTSALAEAADLRDLYGTPLLVAEQIDEAATLAMLAEAQRRAGDLATAEATLERVARLYAGPLANVGGSVNLTTTQVSLALLLQQQGDIAGAEQLLRQVIVKQQDLASTRQWVSWLILGRLYRDQGRLGEATAALDTAIELVEAQRGAIDDVPLRIGYFAQAVEPYLARIDLLLDGDPRPAAQHEALGLTERARARTFLDTLAGEDTNGHGPGRRRPLTPALIDEHIRGGDAWYLSYFATGNGVHVWVLPPTGALQYRRLPIAPAALRDKTAALRRRIQTEDIYVSLSRDLFDALVEPVRPLLADLPRDGRLTVVPHGALNLLPFDALLDDKGSFWTLGYQVSYLPSLSALGALPGYRFCGDERLLTVTADDPLEPLRHASEEAKRVAASFGDQATSLGDEATRDEVVELSEAHEFILFATHARPEPTTSDALDALDQPGRFYLQLGAGERLTVDDIDDLRLRPGLVALSACDTHLGPRLRGDELMTLSRAFLTAGTSSVLASLWRVEDEATAQIVTRFFAALTEGAEPAAALRKAQRAYRAGDGRQHPRYWAPWVIVGAQQPVSRAPHTNAVAGCRQQ
jgi:CHAT domain-containing protein